MLMTSSSDDKDCRMVSYSSLSGTSSCSSKVTSEGGGVGGGACSFFLDLK
jgi:hypothetical protein